MSNQRGSIKATPKYLYAIIDEPSMKSIGIRGILEKKVRLVPQKKIAAVVSNLKRRAIRPKRRNLAAHHQVLNTLLHHNTPLPVTFGIIADSTSAIKSALSENQEIIEEAFSRIHGKIEMGLRVILNVPNIYEYFTDRSDDLRMERDRLYGSIVHPGRDEKIGLGSLFDQVLNKTREQNTITIEPELDEMCCELKHGKCRDENTIMDMACLINRGNEKNFEKKIQKMATQFEDSHVFRLNGPWVPHSFVDLTLDI